MDCSLPGSSVHRIFQAIVLEWIVISFSRRSSQLRDRTLVSRIVDRRFSVWATREVGIKFMKKPVSHHLGKRPRRILKSIPQLRDAQVPVDGVCLTKKVRCSCLIEQVIIWSIKKVFDQLGLKLRNSKVKKENSRESDFSNFHRQEAGWEGYLVPKTSHFLHLKKSRFRVRI